jgi:hypothetical protein
MEEVPESAEERQAVRCELLRQVKAAMVAGESLARRMGSRWRQCSLLGSPAGTPGDARPNNDGA